MVTNIPAPGAATGDSPRVLEVAKGEEVIPWKSPDPARSNHRVLFLLLAQTHCALRLARGGRRERSAEDDAAEAAATAAAAAAAAATATATAAAAAPAQSGPKRKVPALPATERIGLDITAWARDFALEPFAVNFVCMHPPEFGSKR
jgi:pyruvate/2-oxoglutarate dehydrogenase complex dihydrolipoamide acyltransferase (E2) component